MPTYVTETPAADSQSALSHFEDMLTFETDCWDVHASSQSGETDFLLFDVRSPEMYAKGHLPGAINIMHGKMTKRRMEEFPEGKLMVVYCAGPHCNGANKAAVRLAGYGIPVKMMIGGITGWIDEGFDLVTEAVAAQ